MSILSDLREKFKFGLSQSLIFKVTDKNGVVVQESEAPSHNLITNAAMARILGDPGVPGNAGLPLSPLDENDFVSQIMFGTVDEVPDEETTELSGQVADVNTNGAASMDYDFSSTGVTKTVEYIDVGVGSSGATLHTWAVGRQYSHSSDRLFAVGQFKDANGDPAPLVVPAGGKVTASYTLELIAPFSRPTIVQMDWGNGDEPTEVMLVLQNYYQGIRSSNITGDNLVVSHRSGVGINFIHAPMPDLFHDSAYFTANEPSSVLSHSQVDLSPVYTNAPPHNEVSREVGNLSIPPGQATGDCYAIVVGSFHLLDIGAVLGLVIKKPDNSKLFTKGSTESLTFNGSWKITYTRPS